MSLMSSQPFREHGERPVAHGSRSDSGCFCVAELPLLEDLDYDGICTAARVYPLTGVKKDELDTALGYFEPTRPACATTGSAPAACSSAPEPSSPAAKSTSASASNSQACAGPSPAPMPSPRSAASKPAASKTGSGMRRATRNQQPDQRNPLNDLAHLQR